MKDYNNMKLGLFNLLAKDNWVTQDNSQMLCVFTMLAKV
jgi:hypothetical protein